MIPMFPQPLKPDIVLITEESVEKGRLRSRCLGKNRLSLMSYLENPGLQIYVAVAL